MAFLQITSAPAKGTPGALVMTLADLVALSPLSSDPYWGVAANIKSAILMYESTVGGQKKLFQFDFDPTASGTQSATATATIEYTDKARDVHQVKRLIVKDYDNDEKVVERAALLSALPSLASFDFDMSFVGYFAAGSITNDQNAVTMGYWDNGPFTGVAPPSYSGGISVSKIFTRSPSSTKYAIGSAEYSPGVFKDAYWFGLNVFFPTLPAGATTYGLLGIYADADNNLYVCGYIQGDTVIPASGGGTQPGTRAALWKNGTYMPVTMPTGHEYNTSSQLNAIVVSDTSTWYACGSVGPLSAPFNEGSLPALFNGSTTTPGIGGGTLLTLPSGIRGDTTDLEYNSGDVYVVGYERLPSTPEINFRTGAVLWTNGTPTILGNIYNGGAQTITYLSTAPSKIKITSPGPVVLGSASKYDGSVSTSSILWVNGQIVYPLNGSDAPYNPSSYFAPSELGYVPSAGLVYVMGTDADSFAKVFLAPTSWTSGSFLTSGDLPSPSLGTVSASYFAGNKPFWAVDDTTSVRTVWDSGTGVGNGTGTLTHQKSSVIPSTLATASAYKLGTVFSIAFSAQYPGGETHAVYTKPLNTYATAFPIPMTGYSSPIINSVIITGESNGHPTIIAAGSAVHDASGLQLPSYWSGDWLGLPSSGHFPLTLTGTGFEVGGAEEAASGQIKKVCFVANHVYSLCEFVTNSAGNQYALFEDQQLICHIQSPLGAATATCMYATPGGQIYIGGFYTLPSTGVDVASVWKWGSGSTVYNGKLSATQTYAGSGVDEDGSKIFGINEAYLPGGGGLAVAAVGQGYDPAYPTPTIAGIIWRIALNGTVLLGQRTPLSLGSLSYDNLTSVVPNSISTSAAGVERISGDVISDFTINGNAYSGSRAVLWTDGVLEELDRGAATNINSTSVYVKA